MSRVTDKWRKATDIDMPAPTQFSLRPTIRITAQIHALMKMFPGWSKTDLINDLITVGLTQAITELRDNNKKERTDSDLPSDYEGGDIKEFFSYYIAEADVLLAQVDEINKQKREKGKKVVG